MADDPRLTPPLWQGQAVGEGRRPQGRPGRGVHGALGGLDLQPEGQPDVGHLASGGLRHRAGECTYVLERLETPGASHHSPPARLKA
jgi:hypothetical protein